MGASLFDQLFQFVYQAKNVDGKDPPRTGAELRAARVNLNFKKCEQRFSRATRLRDSKRCEAFQGQFPVVLDDNYARKISRHIMQQPRALVQ
jgi:hypothetical protein